MEVSIVMGVPPLSLDGLQWTIRFSGWWFGTCRIFSRTLGIRIPTDEVICFRGVGIPATSIKLDDLGYSLVN